MDQGIIQSFKINYRHLLITCGVLPAVEKKEKCAWNILNAMQASCDAWRKVTQGTIANCFRHCGFVLSKTPVEEFDEEDDMPLNA